MKKQPKGSLYRTMNTVLRFKDRPTRDLLMACLSLSAEDRMKSDAVKRTDYLYTAEYTRTLSYVRYIPDDNNEIVDMICRIIYTRYGVDPD